MFDAIFHDWLNSKLHNPALCRPAFQPDLLVVGSIGKKGNRKAVGSQASYMARHAGTSVFVIRTNTVQAYE